jgi:hypothetical protein
MELLYFLGVIKSQPRWPAGICAHWHGYRARPEQMARLETVKQVYPDGWHMWLSECASRN